MNSFGRNTSIRFKLIAAFSIMIIPIFLLGFISQKLTYDAIEERVILSNSATIEQSAKLLDMLLLNVKDEYIKILASSQIQDYYNYQVKGSGYTSREYQNTLKIKANNYLTNRVLSSTVISNIWILAGQDNSLGTRFLPLQFDFTNNKNIGWYQKSFDIKSRLSIVGYHPELDIQGSFNSYAMAISGSIKRIKGKTFINESIGIMVIDIDFEFIKKILSDIDLGTKSEIHLISQDGRDVTAGGTNTDLTVKASLANYVYDKTDSGNEMIVYENKKYLMSYESVGNTGLVLIGLLPESEITSAAKQINTWTVLLILVAIGTAIILGLIITLGIGGRIARFSYKMEKVAGGDLEVTMSTKGNDEIAVLGDGFNRMIGELKGYISDSVKNEKIKREMAINLLISQINPHVIYNTLNSVIYLAKENRNEDIIKMVESFINLLHNSIKIGDEGLFATINQEVESIKDYALIQQYRYPDKFSIEWDIDDDICEFKVPRTIIQPLVENALFHGICPLEESGIISISIKKMDFYISITVSDSGEGIDSETLKRLFETRIDDSTGSPVRSIGLSNIKERLKYFYQDNGGMEIKSTPGSGTSVKLKIPL